MMLKRLGYFCLVLLGCATVGFAQKPLSAPTPGERSSVAASGPITFDVVVTDKAGHPMHGLQQSDFTVLDDKQPTSMRGFAAHDAANSDNQEAVFLIMDDVNASFNSVSLERTQTENYLRSDGGHLAVPVAIFLMTDTGLDQITNVSTDGNHLADVLHAKQGQLHELTRSAGFWGAEERLQISLRTVDQFTSYVGRVPGRKLAIWISPGWPIFDNPNVIISSQQQTRIFRSVVGLSDELQRANVIMYSIDPLGPLDAASGRTFLWENFEKPVTKASKANPGDLALQVLVQHSGGRVLLGSNDIMGEIRKCAEDALAWYSVGFDPQHGTESDTWHNIEVKVDRPDAVVRTRSGYYAHP